MSLKQTMDRILLLVRSGYPVIYVVSHEESRVFDFMARLVSVLRTENPNKALLRWDAAQGLRRVALAPAYEGTLENVDWLDVAPLPDGAVGAGVSVLADARPEAALQALKNAEPGVQDLPESLSVFFDLHPLLRYDNPDMVRPLRNTADSFRKYYGRHRQAPGRPYKTIIIVAPTAANLSLEMELDQIVIDFPLPETDELEQALTKMVGRGLLSLPGEHEAQARLSELISGAGRGLTLEDYKLGLNGFAVRGQELSENHIEDMLNLKAKAINNTAVEYTPHVQVRLGGLDGIKAWIHARRDAIVSQEVRNQFHLPPPQGLMLCGASGGGKSQLAKMIAKEFNLALLRLDVGALFGKYVGESEERTRNALQLAELLAPVVLWLDEVDKAFSGIGGNNDSGVSKRVFGTFLTWLAEKQDSVFVVTTANDFKDLVTEFPEFGRKGRFDEIIWVDLPDRVARREIFNIYLEPLHKVGYLRILPEDLALPRGDLDSGAPSADEPLARLCHLLSFENVSGLMTGAEIEHVVKDALYKAYNQQRLGGPGGLTVPLLRDALAQAMGRSLYHQGSPAAMVLNDLRMEAQGRGWPLAGNPPDGIPYQGGMMA